MYIVSQLITITVPPQASSYPGSGNGRPGIHPPSHPPHCAKPEESGPLILRYNTHFSTDQWTAGGVLFISLCLLCVSPAFAEFSFTCLVGLTNALEQDGFISGFMGFYVKKVRGGPALNLPPPSRLNILNSSCAVSLSLQGEPHMSTAYAVMMSYWEGVLHYLLFLIIIHRMFKG